nr:RHS repeat-associated core domain-containing protein [Pseudoalteromonas sp. T1lg22]
MKAYGLLYSDQLSPIAILDSDNNVTATFIYGTRVNVPDYMVKDGISYKFITDQLGSPLMVVDTATGNIAQQLTYDAFGRVLSDSNPGFQPFGFAGGLYDKETGLVRFGARDYDAYVGRWTNKDPIRFFGGDTNLYSYGNQNPVMNIDPSGLIIFGYSIGGGFTFKKKHYALSVSIATDHNGGLIAVLTPEVGVGSKGGSGFFRALGGGGDLNVNSLTKLGLSSSFSMGRFSGSITRAATYGDQCSDLPGVLDGVEENLIWEAGLGLGGPRAQVSGTAGYGIELFKVESNPLGDFGKWLGRGIYDLTH